MSEYTQANSISQSAFLNSSKVSATHADESRGLALAIAEAAADRKAGDIVLLHVADVSYLADYFAIVTGYSRVQVRAIADAIEDKVVKEWHRKLLRTEGKNEGTWVLQDYGDVLVHIMMPSEREFYNLEAFWGHAERIDFPTASGDGRITK
ncbi:ribosome silencing factor [Scytonema millei]|uniref:Ribosomal silencing factor RsfS n=1 Tax=Scytonema millei VB511283 TaxID=1245923 RepID=A0A9X5I1T6_9CYAN|nr:ribosome silencing factor [Scytonema millei]NHC33448.1 ribosome silencing factor [Scytonema millei VB511283]